MPILTHPSPQGYKYFGITRDEVNKETVYREWVPGAQVGGQRWKRVRGGRWSERRVRDDGGDEGRGGGQCLRKQGAAAAVAVAAAAAGCSNGWWLDVKRLPYLAFIPGANDAKEA